MSSSDSATTATATTAPAEGAAHAGSGTTALLLTTLSGLSTGLGAVVVLAAGQPSPRKLGHLLAFSAGVMIYLSFADLLFSSIDQLGFLTANIAFFGGCIGFLLVVNLVPEPDVSNFVGGDSSSSSSKKGKGKKGGGAAESTTAAARRSLLSVGLVTAFGISLHNFPEGIAVYLSCLARGPAVGLPLTLAIAAHNIPEGMAVAAPMYSATGSRWQAIKYTVLSGMCEPLGAVVVALVLGPFMTEWVVQVLLAAVGGIMVVMSLKELVPTTLTYISADHACYSFLAGMVVIFATVHGLRNTLGA